MKHVRFVAMAAEFLRETVGVWPALRSAEAQSMLFNAVLPAVDGTKPVPRSGFGPRLIYVVGGYSDGEDALTVVELYDPQNSSWRQLASMRGARSCHSCVALDGKLYAVGGIDIGCEPLDTAEVYDPQTDGWQPLANMSTDRAGLGLAAVCGKVYAIGGVGSGSTLDSVEAYDPQLGAWAPVASTGGTRSHHASVVLDGKIYIMGGFEDRSGGSDVLDTVEVYDPQVDSWQRVANMPHGLDGHAAAAIGGKIYVTSGTLVCVYDPQVDTWMQPAGKSNFRGHASAAVGGKLYVFGGLQGPLSTVEVYDPASDSWAQGPNSDGGGDPRFRADLMAVAL